MKKAYTLRFISGILISIFIALLLFLLPVSGTARTTPVEFNSNVWLTSWDYQAGLKEARHIQSQLNSISYFAASFDARGRIILPDSGRAFSREKFSRYRTDIKKYLTIVNDVHKNEVTGEWKTKDTEILRQLLRTPESRQAHIAELLQAVKKYQYQGLEIDYENVWRNPFLAYHYIQFLRELIPPATEQGISLRVLLEPGVPAIKYIFPEGPEYIIMCYNLYGAHTADGGPKADKEFLQKMLDKMSNLPRPHGIALATGGCVWQQGEKPRFVTAKEAQTLQKSLRAVPQRDTDSEALYFTGSDSRGKAVECWYADEKTIIAWKRQAMDYGVDGLSLWRLGNNGKIASYYPGIMEKR